MSAARKEYYTKELNSSKGNTAAVWRLIRDIVSGAKQTTNCKNIENNKIEEFNHLFAKVRRKSYITPEIEENPS